VHEMTPAQWNVTRIIQDEHESLASVIRGMQYFTHAIEQGGKTPDLRLFRAMLVYMNDYPERVHHPKEDRYLFARLRKRTSEMDLTLAELEYQHAQGAGLTHEIQHALARFEFEGLPAFPALRRLVDKYAQSYLRHMEIEEGAVLSAAARFLTAQDWLVIEAAFSEIPAPLTGALIRNDFAKLFSLAEIPPNPPDAAKRPD
jgi:hemerythrin-like domain-containing protein